MRPLNARLEESCREDLKRRLRGKSGSKRELLAEELGVIKRLPQTDFEATRASSLSLVRFDGNDYSVPVRCAHREVVVKGDCERVRIYHGEEEVAEHRRIWCPRCPQTLPAAGAAPRSTAAAPSLRVEARSPRLRSCVPRAPGSAAARSAPDACPREYIGVLRLLEKRSFKLVERAVGRAQTPALVRISPVQPAQICP